MKNKEWKSYSLLISPTVIFVIFLQFYPLAYSFYISFQEWALTSSQLPQGFNYLKNYNDILNDSVFHRAVKNSLVITITSVFSNRFRCNFSLLNYRLNLDNTLYKNNTYTSDGNCSGSCWYFVENAF